MTLFSDEQLVALSNVFERAILRAASARSAVSSTIAATLPAPTPIAGVPLEYAARTLVCEPVATTQVRLPHQLERVLARNRRGQRLHEIARRADAIELGVHERRAAARASMRPSATARRTIALRPLSALMMLFAGVAPGFVDGVIAATTPTGRAISIMPLSGSSAMTPTDLRAREIAQQAHRLAAVLGDLVGDVAEAGVAHGELGQRAVARRLHDRPAGGGDQLVDLEPAYQPSDRALRARAARATIAAMARRSGALMPTPSFGRDLRFADHVLPFASARPSSARRTRPAVVDAASAPCASSFSFDVGHLRAPSHRVVEPRDDGGRRLRRHEHAVPRVDDAVDALLGDRRHVRRARCCACRSSTAIGAQLARLHVLPGCRHRHEQDSTWPPSASVTAGPPPLYGTCTMSTPVFSLNSSPAMCDGEPMPTDA